MKKCWAYEGGGLHVNGKVRLIANNNFNHRLIAIKKINRTDVLL
jgi:hypothetical protein